MSRLFSDIPPDGIIDAVTMFLHLTTVVEIKIHIADLCPGENVLVRSIGAMAKRTTNRPTK